MAHFISVIHESWHNLGLSEQEGENHSAHNKNYAFENWNFWNSEEEEKNCDFLRLVEINAFRTWKVSKSKEEGKFFNSLSKIMHGIHCHFIQQTEPLMHCNSATTVFLFSILCYKIFRDFFPNFLNRKKYTYCNIIQMAASKYPLPIIITVKWFPTLIHRTHFIPQIRVKIS